MKTTEMLQHRPADPLQTIPPGPPPDYADPQGVIGQKIAILREHLLDKVPISEVCEPHGLQPTLFYHWQKKLFEEGAGVFKQGRRKSNRQKAVQTRRIEALEAKVKEKNEMLVELINEHVAPKTSRRSRSHARSVRGWGSRSPDVARWCRWPPPACATWVSVPDTAGTRAVWVSSWPARRSWRPGCCCRRGRV